MRDLGVHVLCAGWLNVQSGHGKGETSIRAPVIRGPEKGFSGKQEGLTVVGQVDHVSGWGTHSLCHSPARREPMDQRACYCNCETGKGSSHDCALVLCGEAKPGRSKDSSEF
jgi:hypothetical protein